ncbi:hypothetical protein ACLOJK_004621 [Asimina triloba]
MLLPSFSVTGQGLDLLIQAPRHPNAAARARRDDHLLPQASATLPTTPLPKRCSPQTMLRTPGSYDPGRRFFITAHCDTCGQSASPFHPAAAPPATLPATRRDGRTASNHCHRLARKLLADPMQCIAAAVLITSSMLAAPSMTAVLH